MRKNRAVIVEEDTELISLNLVFDQSVTGSKYQVLRDLIQNFYEAAGPDNWSQQFSWEMRGQKLVFRSDQIHFSYDWLIRADGFKKVILDAYRDFSWLSKMASRDWEFEVAVDHIGGDPIGADHNCTDLTGASQRNRCSLVFRLRRLSVVRKETVLEMYPFAREDTDILKCALYSFYYKENPLIGEPIWTAEGAAVFRRSPMVKPDGYPATFQHDGEGIIFVGYQALGSIRHSLIFALHGVQFDVRQRGSFYRMDVVKIVKQIVSEMPSEAAFTLLKELKSVWDVYPRGKVDFNSWYDIIGRLANLVSRSREQTRLFRSEHPLLLVAHAIEQSDVGRMNQRRQALNWLQRIGEPYQLVQDGFLALGYMTLEQTCSNHGGFSRVGNPNREERRAIALLENVASRLFPDFFDHGPPPPCKVFHTKASVWIGRASRIPLQPVVVNRAGLKVHYRLSYIALKERLFKPGCFSEALCTYLYERAHQFGGDQSASFSKALTTMIGEVIKHANWVGEFEAEWDQALGEIKEELNCAKW